MSQTHESPGLDREEMDPTPGQELKKVSLHPDGKILNEEGDVVATYDKKTQVLEFADAESDELYREQCVQAVGQKKSGTAKNPTFVPSGRIISEFRVKGDKGSGPKKNAPPRPRMDPSLGDTTPAVVKWYFEHYPEQAYRRYRVFLDKDGQPVRRDVSRRSIETIDDRAGTQGLLEANDGKGQKVGKNKWEGGPIQRKGFIDQFSNQIIARRPTCMTFLPAEVVGGFDFQDEPTQGVGMRDSEEGLDHG